MFDRQNFEKTVLPNGITTYFLELKEVGFTDLILQVPVGLAHSTGSFPGGAFHFLEHLCLARSQKYPGYEEYGRLVGLKGGIKNAHTNSFQTTYELSIPNQHFHKATEGLISMVFNPLILAEDIALNRGIIANEVKRERWYPGGNEIGQYLLTKWKSGQVFPKSQIYGDEKDWQAMTPELLIKAHQNYFDPQIVLIAAGAYNISALNEELAKIKAKKRKMAANFNLPGWENRQYHEHAFRDIDRFELWYGGIVKPLPGVETVRQINFILGYLNNFVHGPIYRWLREELGWVYEVGANPVYTPHYLDWNIWFPLASKEQVETVKRELWQRVEKALSDEIGVNNEVERILGASAYWYQTPDQIVQDGLHTLNTFGRIITVEEWKKHINSCRDLKSLRRIYKKYFNPKQISSMCATPPQ